MFFFVLQNRDLLQIVSNRNKLQILSVLTLANWWETNIRATRMSGLVNTSYTFLDLGLLSTFVERWYGETIHFHISIGEITVTLYDMHCLLHLPIEGHLLDHHGIIFESDVDLMVNYIGSSSADTDYEVTSTKGNHACTVYIPSNHLRDAH
jgi:hypothetical protein